MGSEKSLLSKSEETEVEAEAEVEGSSESETGDVEANRERGVEKRGEMEFDEAKSLAVLRAFIENSESR